MGGGVNADESGPPALPRPSHDDVSAFIAAVLAAVNDGITLNELASVETHDALTMGMYNRLRGLYDGVAALLAARLPDEALILVRSMFEESLRLQQLGSTGNARAALLMGWYRDSILRKRGLIRRAARRDFAGQLGVTLEDLDAQDRSIEPYLKRHGIGATAPFLPIDAAARRFDREDEAWMSALADELVHGSEIAHGSRRVAVGTNGVGFHIRSEDPSRAAWVAALASNSMPLGRVAIGPILGWPNSEALGRLVGRIDGYFEERNGFTPGSPA
jgi:hypothetical protein